MSDSNRTIPCPYCGGPAAIGADNPWRPFCCKRCKMIDLGDWLAEEHRIPDEGGKSWEQPYDPDEPQH